MIATPRGRLRRMGLLGLVAGLLPWPGRAAGPLDQAGALLWEMGEIHTDFGHHSFARGMTDDKLGALAAKAARKLVGLRDELATLLPGLDPETRFARELASLVQTWPDRQAFHDELLRNSDDRKSLGMVLAGLMSQAPDTRRRWKTPFPIFRP